MQPRAGPRPTTPWTAAVEEKKARKRGTNRVLPKNDAAAAAAATGRLAAPTYKTHKLRPYLQWLLHSTIAGFLRRVRALVKP